MKPEYQEALKLIQPDGVLHPFMSRAQRSALSSALHGEEAAHFAQTLQELATRIDTMPVTYEQDGKGDQAVVYLHYFYGGMDFWITEKDMDGGVTQAFGLACITGDMDDAELGYISITEIVNAGVELDLYWEPKTLAEVKRPTPTAPRAKDNEDTEFCP